MRLPPPSGECLVARNRQKPSRNRGPRLERGGLAPDVEEDIAQKVFGQSFVSHQTKQPAVDRHAMPRTRSRNWRVTIPVPAEVSNTRAGLQAATRRAMSAA